MSSQNKILQLFLLILLSKNLLSQDLKHYTCFIDRIDISEWMKNGKRSFDEKGIIKNKNKYHPLGIIHYGLLNYHEFLKTNDSIYYKKLKAQINYFKDTSKVILTDNGKGLGLPYNYKHADLKPPWYSGMTQGSALSLLLRYKSISNDKEVDPIIKKIAYKMLLPINKGGTIGKTTEGYTWIEEYPNSKNSPQVLNGFINGLIGLKEYSDHFPKDTMAKRIHDESYQSLKLCLSKYDMNNWTNYNRKNNSRCTVLYLRYEIMEMKHLFEIYQDSIFLDQMKIWSTYAEGKPMKAKRTDLKLKGFQHAKNISFSNNTNSYTAIHQIDTIGYWNENTIENKTFKKIKNKKRKSFYNISTDSLKAINYIILKNRDDIEIKNIALKNNKGKWESIPINYFEKSLYIKLNESIKNTDLLFKIKHRSTFNPIEIILTEVKEYQMPFFYYYKTKDKLTKGKYEFTFKHLENIEDITIFYKSAKNDQPKQKNKWIATNCLKGEKGIYEVIDDKAFHDFMVVYQPTHIESAIGKVEFIKID